MVNVVSTNASADVSEEYAERVEALIAAGTPDRETTQKGRHGEEGLRIQLYAYEAPGSGEARWAVDYHDGALRELEEYATETEAQERYEEMVRAAAGNLDFAFDRDGNPTRFTSTDVEGVPGPLPELPTVTLETVLTLLDEPSEEPVLYVERTEDGEAELAFGPAAYTHVSRVVLTRAEVLEAFGLSDEGDDGRITQDAVVSDEYDLDPLVDEADQKVREVALGLF
jgi:hypothetical protein